MARVVAVTGSGVLFALAVLQAQQGCDHPEPEPEQTTSPARVETLPVAVPDEAEPARVDAKVEPTAAAPSANAAPEAKPEPEPTKKSGVYRMMGDKDPAFFPASKSGGLHVYTPPPAQQQAPNAAPQQVDE